MAVSSAARLLSISPVTSPSLAVAQTGCTAGPEPSGLGSETFAGMPFAPGNEPNRLSKEWFSIMTSMTYVTGTGAPAREPATGAPAARESAPRAATEGAAATRARTGTLTAASARTLSCRTSLIVPAPVPPAAQARPGPIPACGAPVTVRILRLWATEMCWAPNSSHVDPTL